MGASLRSHCRECPAGYYCDETGMYDASISGSTDYVGNLCEAGYYCELGSEEQTNGGTECDDGYMCPEGSTYQ